MPDALSVLQNPRPLLIGHRYITRVDLLQLLLTTTLYNGV
jgi:hypothetical protein